MVNPEVLSLETQIKSYTFIKLLYMGTCKPLLSLSFPEQQINTLVNVPPSKGFIQEMRFHFLMTFLG